MSNRAHCIKVDKLIDPCMGSGHILVYAFEVFMKLYISASYNKKDIPELILKNNLYGLDIDDRAGQFAIISVMLKAREYDSEIFNKIDFNSLNILSIPESSPELRQYANDIKDKEVRDIVDYLIDTFENGKEIGSLLIVEEKDYDKVTKYFEEATPNIFNRLLWEGLKDIIRVAKILSKKYDVVVTNPPYLPTSKMSAKCKEYIEKNYPASKSDLCTAFMENKLVDKDRYLGMINMHGWMFINSYIDFRKAMVSSYYVTTLIHLGTRAFEEMGGEVIQTASFVFKKISLESRKKSVFVRLVSVNNSEEKKEKFLFNRKDHIYVKDQNEFISYPNNVFAYWINSNFGSILSNAKTLDSIIDIRQGLAMGDNNRFLRYWFEVCNDLINLKSLNIEEFHNSGKKYAPYNKGGGHRKWYGNNEFVIMFDKYNYNLLANQGNHLPSKQFYFKKGITWSLIGINEFAARLTEGGFVFDVGGSSGFSNDSEKLRLCLALLCNKVAVYILNILNPTTNNQIGDIKNISIVNIDDFMKNEIVKKVDKNVNLSTNDWDSFETSWDFRKHPLV